MIFRPLCLDPSVMNRCGWATLDLEIDDKSGEILKEEWDYGFWEVDGLNFQMRCADLRDYIASLQNEFQFDTLICEWPMFYDSGRGHVAAQQGYTINLAGIAMYIAGWFHIPHQRLFLYTAPQWKGTVSKAITQRRFFRMFGLADTQVDHNAIDAVMLLVYHLKEKKYIK